MKFASRLKQVVTANAGVLTLGTAILGYRTLAQVITVGASDTNALKVGDTGVCFVVEDSAGNWEEGLYTIASNTQLTRTSITASSNSGAAAAFSGSLAAFCSVPGTFLTGLLTTADGTSLPAYLAANPGGTPGGTDTIPSIQGGSLFGITVSALATVINKLWPGVPAGTLTISSTAAFPLDFTTHHRKRIFCTATPAAINGPTTYTTVGDGFECDIVNLSGAVIPLGSGIVALPSGTSIPIGGVVRLFSGAGVIYANLNAGGAAAGSVPGQVTGLTLGTATSTTQPLSWAAVSGATGYKVEYKLNTDSAWTVAFANNAGVSCTVPSLTAATSYNYRVTAFNGSGPGTASTTVTGSTAAASTQVITVNTPTTQTVGTPFNVTGTYANGTPTALDYRLSDDTAGVWTQPTGTVTISSGTFSFSITPSTTSAGRTISVRDRTTQVAGTSGSYIVNAAGGGTTAPFTVTNRAGFPADSGTFTGTGGNAGFTDIVPTGSATVVSVTGYMSESNTTPPPSDGTRGTTSPRGDSVAASLWGAGQPNLWQIAPLVRFNITGSPISMYAWVKIVDSNGATWWFRRQTATRYMDNMALASVANAEAMVQV